MALRYGADGYPQPCPPELWATSKAILCRRHRLFAAVIHLIANDDWPNMAQCSILHLSPPTPLKELDLTRPQLAGFFWSKFRFCTVSGEVPRWRVARRNCFLRTRCMRRDGRSGAPNKGGDARFRIRFV